MKNFGNNIRNYENKREKGYDLLYKTKKSIRKNLSGWWGYCFSFR